MSKSPEHEAADLRRFAGTLNLPSSSRSGGYSHHEVYVCGRLVARDSQARIMVKDGRAWYDGVVHCKRPWDCPVCSYRISLRRSRALRHVVSEAGLRGYRVLLGTFTFSHKHGDRLKPLRDAFAQALEKMRSTRRWKGITSRHGFVGYVRGQEVTYGKNGWHPHCHELWIVEDGVNVDELRKDVQAAYSEALAKVGLSQVDGVGFDVREADTEIAKYIAKFGRPPRWDAAREVTAGRRKGGGKGLTPWQLLKRASEGDAMARSLFEEYAAAYHGTRQMYVSRGLVKLLGLGDTFDDLEDLDAPSDEEKAGAVEVLSLCQQDLHMLFHYGLEGLLLSLAVSHPPDALSEYLFALRDLAKFFGLFYEPPALDDCEALAA